MRKSIQKAMRNEIDFLMHFGSLLDAKLASKWPKHWAQFGAKNLSKIDQKNIEESRCNKMWPRWAKMGPSGPTYGGTTHIGTTISPEVGVAGGGKEGVQPPPTNQPKTGNQPTGRKVSQDLARPGPEAR